MCCHIESYPVRDLHEIMQKRSQKTGGGELKGNSKAVMSAPALINEIQIALIKMRIPHQLNLIWLGGITTIALDLAVGQKINANPQIPFSFIIP